MPPPEEMELWDRIRFMESQIKSLEERVTQLERSDYADAEIDKEYNQVILGFGAPNQLTVADAIRLGYIKGQPEQWQGYATWDTDQPSPIESGPDATPDRSDREPGEREDSVGRRRRRQIFDGSGILHEEGSSE